MARIDDFKNFISSYQKACARGNLDMASEETIRAWINQMLYIFGWDVKNTNHVLQEVTLDVAERLALDEIGSKNTRPDYTLMNGRTRLFFLDAKKRTVNIREDNSVAFQIRSYGWSIGAHYSIVTNMDELAVYDCSAMPHRYDPASFARILYLRADEYIDNFSLLNGFLGRNETIDNCLKKKITGKDSIDKNFSKVLSQMRLELARAIINGNNGVIGIADLNLWTQIIINRILFIRVCEARGLERDGLLKDFAEEGFWEQFKISSYLKFHDHYDGPMFSRISHIHNLNICNDVFNELLSYLYYPSPYCFDVIPLKSISDIYDLFLGYHLEYDDSGDVSNVLKSEFQKNNGAVTTPEQIVLNTIRSTISQETLQSLSNEQILGLKILDPACGSGVFLVSIFDHLARQIENNLHEQNDSMADTYLYEKDGNKRLNIEGRKLIVNKCLYGVDINQECVEVAKLSLSLKLIDDYDPCDFVPAGLYGAQILHEIGMNIKCGNSLVEPDILEQIPALRQNLDELDATNIFNYRTAFREVFCQGGFDYVIGNPPYVEVKNYNTALPSMASYIKNRYISAKNGKIDLAIPFIERGLELLNKTGSLGYIVQKRFFKTDYGKGIRKLLSKERYLRAIYDYAETDLFEGRITYVAIVVCDKSSTGNDSFKYTHSKENNSIDISKSTVTENPWSFENNRINELRVLLAQKFGTLGDVCNIKVGLQALWDKAYHIAVDHTDEDYIYGSTALCKDLKVERGACRVLLCNEQFIPLSIRRDTVYVLFPYDIIDSCVRKIKFSDYERRFPLAGQYLREHRLEIESNVQTVPQRSHNQKGDEYWHLFTRVNNHNSVYKKLCIPMTSQNPQASVVMKEDAYCDNANMFFIQIPSADDNKLNAMAAIINSTPFALFAKSIANPQKNGFYKFNKQFLSPVPFPCNSFLAFNENMQRLAALARQVEEINTKISHNTSHAHRLYPLLSDIWKDIDVLCCELYGMAEEEINFIISNQRIDHQYE